MAPNGSTVAAFPDGIAVEDRVITVEGRTHHVEIPQRYYDFAFVLAHFPAPTRRLGRLLPNDSLEPVEIVPGIAVLSLAAFEYRRMATLKPYKEVAVMVPVRHEPDSGVPFLPLLFPDRYRVGFWIHHLPVTTQEACDVGIGVWGLPKVVAGITVEDVGWMRRCELFEDGEHVLTLSAHMAETRLEARQFQAFSVLNGELLRSLVDTRGQYHAWYAPGRASFSLGTHEAAETLREVEVENFAVAGLFSFTTKSRLHPGTLVTASAATGPDML